jgi:sterol desaturase/sphingolipid hydroxylase (fatty acid hydroxylase superfamily)
MKRIAFSWFQPVMIVLLVSFWAVAPAPLVHNPWTLVTVNILVIGIGVLLEFVNERHASWRITPREFFTDLFYQVLTFTVIAQATKWLCDEPVGRIKHALGITTPWIEHMPLVLQILFVIVVIDFGQYWMHKAMHHTWLWYSHAPHHHITQMNAMKGAVGNPTELFLITISVIALFDVPDSAMFGALSVMGLFGVCTHANVRWNPPRWFVWTFNTIESHSLHHSAESFENTRCNFGGTLLLFDHLLGTYRAGEAELVGQDDRKRLSIWEQTTFTFRPLIAAFKSRQGNSESVAG